MNQILIIEDSKIILENVAELLEMEGYKTLLASDGYSGLQIAFDHLPDLILCDIKMAKMNGFEVRKKLMLHPLTCNTPFVFITACAQINDILKIQHTNAKGYIIKPFEDILLLQTVELCMAQQIIAV